MLSRLGKAWRLIATAIAFASFGLGGVLLQIVGVPLLYVLIPWRERRQKVARHLVHRVFQIYVQFMAVMGIYRYRVENPERLRRPGLVIVANHPTLLDVVFLLSLVPDATCIVRAGLAGNPFTRAAVRSAGYVCNDWGVELVEACVQALQRGSSLIVFPEGTRTNPLRPQKWHRGAANVALRANAPLTPVWISCQPPSLRKGEPWWHIPPRRMQYQFRVLDDLTLAGKLSGAEGSVQAARSLTDRMKRLLMAGVEQNAGA